jgi:flagellar motor switch protein FliG
MNPEMAERVRNALMELEEIPQALQTQVIADFLGRGDSDSDGGVEFDASLARRLAADMPALREQVKPDVHERPFQFLQDAEPSLLAAYLEREHPQTAAVVISHLAPEQAALVLEQMPADISTEALRRMAWLDELSPEVLRDVEREIKAALLPKMRRPESRRAGLASVQAVLSAVQGSRRSELLDRLAEQDQRLVRQLGFSDRTEKSTFQYRLEPPPLLERATVDSQQSHGNPLPDLATDSFEELLALDDRDLRRVFAAAEMPLLVLALTGADEKFIRRIVRQLPARDTELLRHRLTHPGPLRLRDIEAAQLEIVRLAHALASRGEINLRPSTFAAAV